MHLFYAPHIFQKAGELNLDEAESLHFHVLRIADDESFLITNGKGVLCKAQLLAKTKRQVRIKYFDCIEKTIGKKMHLAVAPLKHNDRFDMLLEKITELGITDIWPVYTHYTERKKINEGRMEKRLVAAMKQSQRVFKPQLHPLLPVGEFFEQLPDTVFRLIAHCKHHDMPLLSEALKNASANEILVLVGPEGGFSEDEIYQAVQSGFKEVSLSTNRLRTETAAMVAAMMMQIGESL